MHCAVAITDFLFLGSYAAITKENFLEKNGIKYIVNATMEIPDCKLLGIETFRVKITDGPASKIGEHFDQVSDFIEKKHKDGEKVFVHCVAGVSRSATLVIAYLMKHQKLRLMDAYALVKSKRTMIRPNSGFWFQLVEYEQKLFKENTVTMISTNLGWMPSVYETEIANMVW